MLKQVHLYIKGRVIGVGFRAWTKFQAKLLGIRGWVKNVYDKPEIFGEGGGVESIIQGEESKIEKMVELLKKGPPLAHVESVEICWEDPKELFSKFEIIR